MTVEKPKLYIVNHNIDAARASYHCRKGNLERISSGVYLVSGLTDDERREVVLRNAARIAHTRHPFSALGGSSAYHHAAVDGVVCLSSDNNYVSETIAGVLEVYSANFEPPPGLKLDTVRIDDDLGEFTMKALPDDILLLQAFRRPSRRPPRQVNLNAEDLRRLAERCIRRHDGSAQALLDRLGKVADKLDGFGAAFRGLTRFIEQVTAHTAEKQSRLEYTVFWSKIPVATLNHDGLSWVFEYVPGNKLGLTLHQSRTAGAVPSFLGSLLPETQRTQAVEEGMTGKTQFSEKDFAEFKVADRYVSNIVVRPKNQTAREPIIVDCLEGSLTQFSDDRQVFTGKLSAELRATIRNELARDQLLLNPRNPRISGMQTKIPVNLNSEGELTTAIGKSFTHLLKVAPGAPSYRSMGANEWFTMKLAERCGILTERFALVGDDPDDVPMFLAERFDIRHNLNDTRLYMAEDFWSIMGYTLQKDKYDAELVSGQSPVADAMLDHSTDAKSDAIRLLQQVAYSWLTGNGDMHLKNLMMLKCSTANRKDFEWIRLSPAYDMMVTNIYPKDEHTAALKIKGQNQFTHTSFRDLGRRLNMRVEEIDTVLKGLLVDLNAGIEEILGDLPPAIKDFPECASDLGRACEFIQVRCDALTLEITSGNKATHMKFGEGEGKMSSGKARVSG